jgi:predicted phosphodiesterase
MQILGLAGTASQGDLTSKRGKIEQRIIGWVQAHRQITICGHTHHPVFADHKTPPYFNAGSCVYPGYITGLELQNGELTLVKWTAQSDTQQSKTPHIKREPISPPRKLRLLGI